MAELQAALGLAEPPRIVEGIDIAHLQGGEMVGSKVCFIDGVPFKDGYRRYKIKHGQGNNDYLSIQEVVSRRYREAGAEQRAVSRCHPDRRRARPASCGDGRLQDDGREAADGDLAGQERRAGLHAGQESEPIRLPRNHLGLKLLQYIRDEAHRFAQHYHHILRRKISWRKM